MKAVLFYKKEPKNSFESGAGALVRTQPVAQIKKSSF
jgi:hypothetical protein